MRKPVISVWPDVVTHYLRLPSADRPIIGSVHYGCDLDYGNLWDNQPALPEGESIPGVL